jgi:DNA invertase Pin-like site-specific DNA recombinase
MIVGYARVSTKDQRTDGQIPALKQAKCKRIYEETQSARTMDRPELAKCLDALREGDTLVVWRLDRLARSLRDLVEIVERIEKTGVAFRSLTEKFDTSGASGRLIFHVFASLAQFERELIGERTKLGLAAARARGRFGGRRPSLKAQQIQQVKILWASGDVYKKNIAEQFGVSVSTIDRIVRPPSLKG